MNIGSKVLVKGSYFSHIYKGEIIGEGVDNSRPIWVVLVQFPKLDIELKPIQSSFFKDTLESISNQFTIDQFYIEEEND